LPSEPRSDLGAICETLCSIPSVTGDEAAITGVIQGWLQDTGLDVERRSNNVLARGPRRQKPLVLLVGHSDTVPPSPQDRGVHREGGRLYARGAADMKSGLAVMVGLARDLDFAKLAYDVAFVVYEREEGPILANGLGPLLKEVPWLRDAALAFVLEPSDNTVQVGAMGTLHATLLFHGKSAHSARPWQGDNAIHKAAPVLRALAERPIDDVDVAGFRFREVMSATIAKGGLARNVIPDRFELNVNYRFSPARSVEDARRAVEALVAGHADVEITDLAPSGKVIGANPLYERFLATTRVSVTGKQAWTDVAQLTRAGIDAVNFGPGNQAQAHQAGEYVDLALLDQSYALFSSFLGAA
jgi:succinyl-diaminopimelate desuccinylase